MSDPDPASVPDEADLVVLTRTETPFEADLIVARLVDAGVQAYAAHRRLEDIFPTLFSEDGTAVVVRADQVDTAIEALGATES